MTLRERAAKALGCERAGVHFQRALSKAGWWFVYDNSGGMDMVPDNAYGFGASQAEAVADIERKAQARQEG